jgi:membrane-bound inhibitor of C-type lysozyme
MRLVSATLVFALLATPVLADASVTIGLTVTGDMERKTLTYTCTGDAESLTVEYVNAAPNFLALIPVKGETLVFASTLTASGAKYQAGPYIWWNKGTDATLSDATEGLDAAPVLTCSENNETP